jgi:hypothetical protein
VLFYEIIAENNRHLFSLSRVKTQSSISLSTLIANNKISDGGFYLKKSLQKIDMLSIQQFQKHYVDIMPKEYKGKSKDKKYYNCFFSREIQEISLTLTKLLQDNIKINEVMKTGDKEEIGELYFRIAAVYSQTPDLRITWLNALSSFHENNGFHAEAAVTK